MFKNYESLFFDTLPEFIQECQDNDQTISEMHKTLDEAIDSLLDNDQEYGDYANFTKGDRNYLHSELDRAFVEFLENTLED